MKFCNRKSSGQIGSNSLDYCFHTMVFESGHVKVILNKLFYFVPHYKSNNDLTLQLFLKIFAL